MKPLKSLVEQTMIYGLGTIVPRLLNYLLLTPFYTRIFITSEYGIITELYAYSAFLFVLLTYGMETTYFRFAENEQNKSRVYSTSITMLLSSSSLFILLVFLFLSPVSEWLRYSEHPEYILIMASIIGIDAFLAIPFSYLRLQRKAFRFAIIKIINIAINILFNFFFLIFCPKFLESHPDSFIQYIYFKDFGVGYAFLSNLIATIATLILLLPEIFKAKLKIDLNLLGKIVSYSFPLLIVGLAGMINEVSDKLLFKYLVSVPENIKNDHIYILDQLGIYGANYKLAVLMTIFIQMFRYAAEPFFFSHAKDKNSKELYAMIMKYFVVFCLTIFLMVTLFIDVFKHFIDVEYRVGLHIVPVVLFSNLLLGVLFNLSVWYKLTDKTRFGAIIAITGGIVTISLNIILVPPYGYTGAAWAHFFCNLTMVSISYYLSRKFFKIPYNMKMIFLYISLALLVFFINRIIPASTQIAQLVLNFFLFATFISIVFIFERKFIIKSIT